MGGIEIKSPLPAPSAHRGQARPWLPQFPERQLACSIRAALKAPPTAAHRAPRGCHPLFHATRESAWALCYGRPGASAHTSPAALRVPRARRRGVGVKRGPGTRRDRRWAGACGLPESRSCTRQARAVFLALLPRGRMLEEVWSSDLL